MITTQHMEEDLSRAYVQAIAAKAGVNLSIHQRSHDYGIDGTFHEVSRRGDQLQESGYVLDFQLKASKNVGQREREIVYDMEVDAFNHLVRRAARKNSVAVILIVLALHEDDDQWIQLSEDQLVLRKCCYWMNLSGDPSANRQSRRIAIPRTNLFTHESLGRLLAAVATGDPTQ